VAKQAAVALAAAGFVAVLLLARASHAGSNGASHATSGSTQSSNSTDSSTQSSDEFDYGSPSVAPSTATPQAQTSVS
jgi:hypothetical protein